MAEITKFSKFYLYAIFLVTVIPLVLAVIMYFSHWLIPSTRTNHGQLLLPPIDIKSLYLQDVTGLSWPAVDQQLIWLILYYQPQECRDICLEQVKMMRKMHIALGKEAIRVHDQTRKAESKLCPSSRVVSPWTPTSS